VATDREGADIMQRIVVGVDGSAGSAQALRWAVEEAGLRQARLQAVQAWQIPYTDYALYVPTVDPAVFEEAGRQILDEVVDMVDASKLVAPVERVLVHGGAGSVLLELAKGADLLVVGARGLGGFTGLLLGSVSQQVVHHSICPVVIVPSAD
jgi:nucleotide-binding universal stress UspA family protein